MAQHVIHREFVNSLIEKVTPAVPVGYLTAIHSRHTVLPLFARSRLITDRSNMISKVFFRLFALDARSTAVEYGVVTAVVLTALLSSLLAMSDSVADAYHTVVSSGVGTR